MKYCKVLIFLSKKVLQLMLADMNKPFLLSGEQLLMPGKEILIAAKCESISGVQIAAAFCILQVPYGKSIHKTALGISVFYRTSDFMGIGTLSSSIYYRVCLQMFELYGKCSLTVKAGFSCVVWASISICRPNPNSTQQWMSSLSLLSLLSLRGVLYNLLYCHGPSLSECHCPSL